MDEKFAEIVLKEKERKISISRLPKQTKEEFVQFASDEFCDDFGMCFKHVWDSFKLWKIFFENMDMKLDKILDEINNFRKAEESSEKKQIKLLSGKRIEVKKEVKK